jgi:signal transduction histidine kinase
MTELATAAVVILTGVVLTVAATTVAWSSERHRQTRDLAHQGDLATRVIADSLDAAVSQVRSLQAFFAGSESVSAAEFGRFGFQQGASPGTVALGFARVVAPGDLAQLRQAIRTERPGYVLVDGRRRVIDEGPRDRPLVPVWYAYQFETVPSILGVDLGGDPRRLEAVGAARARHRPVVSGFVTMLGNTDQAYVDIYGTAADRTQDGVVFATVGVESLVERQMGEAFGEMRVEVVDVTDGGGAPDVAAPDHWAATIDVAGRRWRISLTRTGATGLPTMAALAAVTGFATTASAALITSMVTGARARRREIDELKAATRDKDVFLASVAHELRTPLTSVVGATALLAEGWDDMTDTEVRDLVHVTHAEASDLADLIDDLLVAGRLESGTINFKLEAVDLAHEVRRVADRVDPDGRVELRLPPSGPLVEGDSLRVRQIIRNVLVNAVRHAESTVLVGFEVTEAAATLVIGNDGAPIPPHVAAVLFEPYQGGIDRRAKQGSIGLGLPVSRRLAWGMGGDLAYEYVDGWCAFSLRLPLSPGSVPEPEPAEMVAGP